jgi:membrane protease YdiL (CAAX protease family)
MANAAIMVAANETASRSERELYMSDLPVVNEPFDTIRARTLVWWGGAWFVGLAFLVAFGGSINLLVYTLYPVLLIWVLYECDHANVHIQDFLRTPAAGEWRRIWLVLPSLLVSLACVIVAVALLHVAPSALRDRSTELAIRRGPSSPDALITVVGMVIAAPFVEELVFRGILLHRWSRKWGIVRAALATSAIFAVMHPDPLGAFVFALIMVHLYTRSGTLLVPMAAHALNNAFVVMAIFAGERTTTGTQGSATAATAATAATPASDVSTAMPAAIVLGLIGLIVLSTYFRRVPRMSQWRLPAIVPRSPSSTPAR